MERLCAFFARIPPLVILGLIIAIALLLYSWQLNQVPTGLYWDEMDAGYQAFSFLKTGKDYFGNFLPIHFHSLADFRTPLYIYATVPYVAIFGLSAWAVRLPALIFGLLDILLIYLVTKQITGSKRLPLVTAALLALSPWHFQYSRMGFEATAMLAPFLLGLYSFLRGLRNPKWLMVSALGFGGSPWAYSVAKFFIPLVIPMIILVLATLFPKELLKVNKKYIAISLAILALLALPLMYSNFFNKGGQRFSEISVFTDPTIGPQVDTFRRDIALASLKEAKVGIRTKLINRLAYNKPFFWADDVIMNYMQALSTNFLFLEGDPNIRHSPTPFGVLYKILAIPTILGICYLVYIVLRKPLDVDYQLRAQQQTRAKSQKVVKREIAFSIPDKRLATFLLLWVLIAPLPASITRDGGTHATRLFFLLPALILTATVGIKFLYDSITGRLRFVLLGLFSLFLAIEVFFFFHYFFTLYRWESAPEYQYGYDQIIRLAVAQQQHFDRIVVDVHNNSALMAYLFTLQIDPKIAQTTIFPLKSQQLTFGEGVTIGKFFMLVPGERSWSDILTHGTRVTKTLVIVARSQIRLNEDEIKNKLGDLVKVVDVIRYPDNQPAFYALDTNP